MLTMIEYLKQKYEDKAVEWKDSEDEQQRRYSTLYFDMIEGLRSLGTVHNTYVKIALFKALAHDERVLLNILKRCE